MARIHASQLNPEGDYKISGSLEVKGQTTLEQTDADAALIVSGAMEIVEAQMQAAVQKAKLTIENLGTLGDKSTDETIDLGGFF